MPGVKIISPYKDGFHAFLHPVFSQEDIQKKLFGFLVILCDVFNFFLFNLENQRLCLVILFFLFSLAISNKLFMMVFFLFKIDLERI
jgi:hypothetical protein